MSTISTTAQELLSMKAKVEESKVKLAEIHGAKTEVMKRLKEDFGCDTLESAEKLLFELSEQNEKLEKEIENEFAQIKLELDKIENEL